MPDRLSLSGGDTAAVDVLVVGAGVAGLVAALDLLDLVPDAAIAVIDKGAVGETGSTPLAQGGMAAAVGPDDSPALHAADTIAAGDGLGDPYAVRVMAEEGPDRVADLERRGAVFDRLPGPGGALTLAREGGQTVSRSVRSADATGAEIFRALRAAASGRLQRIQGVACGLAQAPGEPEGSPVLGAWVLLDDTEAADGRPGQRGGLALVRARAVVLATGGCGGLYAATTNRDGATADGVALAAAAGAALVDMEFVQFHPTGLKAAGGATGAWRLLLTEALRGAGAVLVNADGERFMPTVHPAAELAPRHVVTRAILDQPGGAWLDATRLPRSTLEEEFPTVLEGARGFGYDLAAAPVPVEPTQHYLVGGVATDLDARTTVPALWAAGEVACTGVHGANRMAGNSLLQSCVFAHRAARSVAAALAARPPVRPGGDPVPPALDPAGAGGPDRAVLRAELRAAMSAGAGPLRSAAGLDGAAKALEAAAGALGTPQADREGIELANLVRVGRLVVRSARLREESRGVHWREDFPRTDPAWDRIRLRVTDVGPAR